MKRLRRVTEGLISDKQECFTLGTWWEDLIFNLKYIYEKAWEKKPRVCFMDLEMAYDGINMEALWQVLRMHYVSGKLLN